MYFKTSRMRPTRFGLACKSSPLEPVRAVVLATTTNESSIACRGFCEENAVDNSQGTCFSSVKQSCCRVGTDLEGFQQVLLPLKSDVSVTLPPAERVFWNVNVAELSIGTKLSEMINDRHIWNSWSDSATHLIWILIHERPGPRRLARPSWNLRKF